MLRGEFHEPRRDLEVENQFIVFTHAQEYSNTTSICIQITWICEYTFINTLDWLSCYEEKKDTFVNIIILAL